MSFLRGRRRRMGAAWRPARDGAGRRREGRAKKTCSFSFAAPFAPAAPSQPPPNRAIGPPRPVILIAASGWRFCAVGRGARARRRFPSPLSRWRRGQPQNNSRGGEQKNHWSSLLTLSHPGGAEGQDGDASGDDAPGELARAAARARRHRFDGGAQREKRRGRQPKTYAKVAMKRTGARARRRTTRERGLRSARTTAAAL